MKVTLGGIERRARHLQPDNAISPIAVTVAGISSSIRLELALVIAPPGKISGGGIIAELGGGRQNRELVLIYPLQVVLLSVYAVNRQSRIAGMED
jgi:hypothetical protein